MKKLSMGAAACLSLGSTAAKAQEAQAPVFSKHEAGLFVQNISNANEEQQSYVGGEYKFLPHHATDCA